MQKADGYITSKAVQTSNRIYSKPYIAGVSVSLLEIEKNKREVSQIVKTRQENNKKIPLNVWEVVVSQREL